MYHTDGQTATLDQPYVYMPATLREPYTSEDWEYAENHFRKREDERDLESFEAWIESLDPKSYRQITQAVDTIRAVIARCHPSGVGMGRLVRWLGDSEH